MKYFQGQRVRIKPNVNCDPGLEKYCGEIVHVVGPWRDPARIVQFYRLDISIGNVPIVAAEHALEPVYDGNTKLAWNDTSGRVVWSPFLTPAVVRRRVRA